MSHLPRRAGMIGLLWLLSLAAVFFLGRSTPGDSVRRGADPSAAASLPDEQVSTSAKARTARSDAAPAAVRPEASLQAPPKDLGGALLAARTAAVRGGSNPLARRDLLRAIDGLDPGDLPAAAEAAAARHLGQNEAARRLLLTAVLDRWAEIDGEAAAEFVLRELSRDPAAVTSLSYVLERWAASDSDGAYGWLGRKGESLERLPAGVPADSSLYLAGLLKEMAQRNPDQAMARLEEIADANDRQIVLANILVHADSNPERDAWLRRLDNMPEDVARDARDHLIRHLLSVDPESAAGWIDQMDDSAERTQYAEMLAKATTPPRRIDPVELPE